MLHIKGHFFKSVTALLITLHFLGAQDSFEETNDNYAYTIDMFPRNSACKENTPCKGIGVCKPSGSTFTCDCFHHYYNQEDCTAPHPRQRKRCGIESEIDKCGSNSKACTDTFSFMCCTCMDGAIGAYCERNAKGVRKPPCAEVLTNIESYSGHVLDLLIFYRKGSANYTVFVTVTFTYLLDHDQVKYKHSTTVSSPSSFAKKFENMDVKSLVSTHTEKRPVWIVPYPTTGILDNTIEVVFHDVHGNELDRQKSMTYSVISPDDCFIDSRILDCTPRQLDNTNPKKYRTKVFRNEIYKFRGEVFYRACSQKMGYDNYSMTFTWSFYNETGRIFPYPGIESRGALNFSTSFENEDFRQVINLHGYSVPFGNYTVKFSAKFKVIPEMKRKSFQSDRYCRFFVEPLPLRPNIIDGLRRIIGENQSVSIHARDSYDPNQPPDIQGHLTFAWVCDRLEGEGLHTQCKGNDTVISTDAYFNIPTWQLHDGDVFIITVTVSVLPEYNPGKLKPANTTHLVEVIGKTDKPHITGRCSFNCGYDGKTLNPQEDAVFEPYCTYCHKNLFSWTIYGVVMPEGVNHYGYLVIYANTMKPGEEYNLCLEADGSKVNFTVQVDQLPTMGRCETKPVKGIALQNFLTINCTDFTHHDPWPLRYSIYQNHELQKEPGHGIFLQYIGHVPRYRDFFLFGYHRTTDEESTLTVKISTVHGTHITTNVTITMTPTEAYKYIPTYLKKPFYKFDLFNTFENGHFSGAVVIIACLAALAQSKKDPFVHWYKPRLLWHLNRIPGITMTSGLQMAPALREIVNYYEDEVDFALITKIFETSVRVSGILFEKSDWRYDTTTDVIVAAGYIFDSIAVAIKALPRLAHAMAPATESTELYGDYGIYSDNDPDVIKYQTQMASVIQKLIIIFEVLGNTIGVRRSVGQDEVVLNSTIVKMHFFTKKDHMSKLQKIIGTALGTERVKMTKALARTLYRNQEPYYEMKILLINQPLLYWSLQKRRINSDILLISGQNTLTNRSLSTGLALPIDLYLEVANPQRAEIFLDTMNLTLDSESKDEWEFTIPIYRVDVQPRELLVVELHKEKGMELKVLVTIDSKPTLDDVEKNGTSIPAEETSKLMMFQLDLDDEDMWVFLSIMPVKVKMESGSEKSLSVSYSVEFLGHLCGSWDVQNNNLTTKGCTPQIEGASLSKIHCMCTHLTLFAGATFPYHATLDMFKKTDYLLGTWWNRDVVIMTASLWLFCLLLLIFALVLDKRDQRRRVIHILGDNVPGERYIYLVTVYTSAREFSGTTARVGILLCGTQGRSQKHVLYAFSKPILQTAAVDWFVICTHRSLGDIREIELWHDSSGHKPYWRCNVIVVRDMQCEARWVFVVQRTMWLALKENPIHVAYQPLSCEELRHLPYLLHENVAFYYREDHLWISIFLRTDRSLMTRAQRVAVMAAGAALALALTTCLIRLRFNFDLQWDTGTFTYGPANAWKALICGLAILPFNCAVMLLFRKSFPSSPYVPYDQCLCHLECACKCRSCCRHEKEIFGDFEIDNGLTRSQRVLLYSLPVDPVTSFPFTGVEEEVLSLPPFYQLRLKTKKKKSKCEKFRDFWTCKKEDEIDKEEKKKMPHIRMSLLNCCKLNRCCSVPYALPFGCLVIAWFLCVAVFVLASCFACLLALHYPPSTGYAWIYTFLTALAIGIFILEPVKVIVLSCLLSGSYRVQQTELDMERGKPLIPVVEPPLAPQLPSALRKDPRYEPQPVDALPRMQKRERRRLHMQHYLLDLVVYFFLLLAVLWVVATHIDTMANRNKKHVIGVFLNNTLHFPAFDDIQRTESLQTIFEYVQYTLAPAVHSNRSAAEDEVLGGAPEGEYTIDPHWTVDHASKLLGVPRMRQQRVFSRDCFHPDFPTSLDYLICPHPLNYETEDTLDHLVYWEPLHEEIKISKRALLKWAYSESTGSWPVIGVFGVYHSNGYLGTLGRNYNNSFNEAHFLRAFNWADERSRLIVIEVVLYNADHNMFTILSLLVETDRSDAVLTTAHTDSVVLFPKNDSTAEILRTLGLVLYAVMVILFTTYQVRLMVKLHFKMYWKSAWEYIDVVITIFAWSSLIFYCVKLMYIAKVEVRMAEGSYDDYIGVPPVLAMHNLFIYCLAFVAFLLIVRLVKFHGFLDRYILEFRIWLPVARMVLAGLLIFMIFLIATALATILAIGNFEHPLRSKCRLFFLLFSVVIRADKHLDPRLFHRINCFLGSVIIVFWYTFCLLFAMPLLRALALVGWRDARRRALPLRAALRQRRARYSAKDALRDEWRYHHRGDPVRGEPLETSQDRLRKLAKDLRQRREARLARLARPAVREEGGRQLRDLLLEWLTSTCT